MTIWSGSFNCKKDIERDFQLSEGSLDDVEILIAAYDTFGYDGYAFVLYQSGGGMYEVYGSHCSCYGLEGQFEPEETSIDALKKYLEGDFQWKNELSQFLKEYESGKMIKKIITYETSDGSQFASKEEAEAHEKFSEVKAFIEASAGFQAPKFVSDLAERLIATYNMTKL